MGAAFVILAYVMQAWAAAHESTLLFAGDAMMHQSQIDAARGSDGTYRFDDYFTAVAPLISAADYAVVNLETPLGGGKPSGYPMFNAPDAYADALQSAGFDLFLTANNHTLDRSDAGLRRTIDVLDAKGIEHIGTYTDAAARDSLVPYLRRVGDIDIAFLNYTYGTNGISARKGAIVDYIERQRIAADIDSARSAGAELICAAVHWGQEYKLLPDGQQRKLADYLVGLGVDMVIGGHPHVIQPMEMRADSTGRKQLVVYSLGNFISGMRTTDTRGGAVVRVRVGRDLSGRAVVRGADYDLVFTEVTGSGPRLVYADSCDTPAWRERCRAFRDNAHRIFDAHNVGINHR